MHGRAVLCGGTSAAPAQCKSVSHTPTQCHSVPVRCGASDGTIGHQWPGRCARCWSPVAGGDRRPSPRSGLGHCRVRPSMRKWRSGQGTGRGEIFFLAGRARRKRRARPRVWVSVVGCRCVQATVSFLLIYYSWCSMSLCVSSFAHVRRLGEVVACSLSELCF